MPMSRLSARPVTGLHRYRFCPLRIEQFVQFDGGIEYASAQYAYAVYLPDISLLLRMECPLLIPLQRACGRICRILRRRERYPVVWRSERFSGDELRRSLLDVKRSYSRQVDTPAGRERVEYRFFDGVHSGMVLRSEMLHRTVLFPGEEAIPSGNSRSGGGRGRHCGPLISCVCRCFWHCVLSSARRVLRRAPVLLRAGEASVCDAGRKLSSRCRR